MGRSIMAQASHLKWWMLFIAMLVGFGFYLATIADKYAKKEELDRIRLDVTVQHTAITGYGATQEAIKNEVGAMHNDMHGMSDQIFDIAKAVGAPTRKDPRVK